MVLVVVIPAMCRPAPFGVDFVRFVPTDATSRHRGELDRLVEVVDL